jgi:hypothetical protein
MNLTKKGIAIGIIALFIGLASTPMSSANITEKEETDIPVEISICKNDGTTLKETVKLTKNDIKSIDNIIQDIQNTQNEAEIEEKITEVLIYCNSKQLGTLSTTEWIENLPGRPIFSFGKSSKFLTRYHGRLQIKKLFSTWAYPTGFGTTIIWGNGIASPPTQILLKRQIGFMFGFVGLYVYIPPFISGMSSRTFFIGSSLLSYGASI